MEPTINMPGTGGGEVTLKFYKGNVMVIGRSSPKSLYSSKIVAAKIRADPSGARDVA
jgi:argininosuccinate synthase